MSTDHRSDASYEGSVVLDIGGDIGALVLRVPRALLGDEIELHPDDAGVARVHSAVRERKTTAGEVYAAVYPQLTAGEYLISGTRQRVSISGGQVTEVELTAAPAEVSLH
jgi:hypothetical protein